jgi:serine/threonine-protein kinase HipA
MGSLTFQIHVPNEGWTDAAEAIFISKGEVQISYDLDYASEYESNIGSHALSLCLPVSFQPYQGDLPGFLLDLIPQGEPLKRLLARHKIRRDDEYELILRSIPLSAPGNIRVKEAWASIEVDRLSYSHEGFTRDDIVKYQSDFIEYMQTVGAPIGGTSGAGGGSPKFLLREDAKGRFHADGMLDDSKTKQAWLVKFPYTDSQNSVLLSITEKAYYDFMKDLPLYCGEGIELIDSVLFIKRFDRETIAGKFLYYGLESFYGAHNIPLHGAPLLHEDNLFLLREFSTRFQFDVLEYLKRDILNQILANPDNHGRNISLLKESESVSLSPIYDVTAMKYFKAEPITRLTNWTPPNRELSSRIAWIEDNMSISQNDIYQSLEQFLSALESKLPKLADYGVPQEFIDLSKHDREFEMASLRSAIG